MRHITNEQPIWVPSPEQISSANMTRFLKYTHCKDYEALYDFSIQRVEQFWSAVWDFCDIVASQKSPVILENSPSVEKAVFFPEAKLNYAQNLLCRRDGGIAIEFFNEQEDEASLTFAQLYDQVAKVADQLRQWGVVPGDRVAGYLPNLPQTVVVMLAATSLGAIWSSCSPDFGISGVLDRFGQIQPKVLFIVDSYFYNGKTCNCLDKLPDFLKGIPSIKNTVVIPYGKTQTIEKQHVIYDDIVSQSSVTEIHFEQLPFNHPLFILFSSGTTGIPKSIVHGAGGTLIQHLKEHQLHCDLKPNDKLFYFTTCGWMMWNWQISALASGASLILYDGNPIYLSPTRLFDIADKTGMTHFGTSAKYIDSLAKLGVNLRKTHRLDKLRMMLSTGSPLVPESFDYVYAHIKSDLCLSSISGGTDIVSCFALGNPIGPVWRGELQTRGLGMKVEVFDNEGKPVVGEKGELVCTAPFPSRPIGFWNDPKGEKYHQAYYDHFDTIWYHGDYVELTTHGGLIIYGRSDTVLNPGGVRIGTAEIYRQVEQIPEVLESLVIGQEWKQDIRVVLFVRLRKGTYLNEDLKDQIKNRIRQNTTPRHVPSKIIEISDIPRTKSGKIAELAVKNIVEGHAIKNKEALANPDSLKLYEHITELTYD